MISYCIACYRPAYARLLIDDLCRKNLVEYEILLWLNCDDITFEKYLTEKISSGFPVRIVGKSIENIGMLAYFELFECSKYELVTQIDDDVVCVSPGIAEIANTIFHQYKKVRQLVADVWQDEYTTGARPEMENYRCFDCNQGLYDGPIDGWFSIYHRSILPVRQHYPHQTYFYLGAQVRNRLANQGMHGLLCTQFKVFHVIGPVYANYFGMLDFEIEKYKRLGRQDIVTWYEKARGSLPLYSDIKQRVDTIIDSLSV